MLTNWLLFFVAVFSCALFLYVPGYLGARGVGFSGRMSVVAAPVVSIVLFCLIGIVFSKAGIISSGWSVLLCASLLCAAPFAVRVVMERKHVGLLGACGWDETCSRGASLAALYIAVSLVAAVFLYVMPLDGPDSYMQTYDNVHHYGLVQSFLSSGDWSSLDSALYLSDYDRSIVPFYEDGGYYPSAWHIAVAMVADIFGVSVPFASNAVNAAFAVFVYPIGMLALMSRIFGLDSKALWFGAVCTPAFSAFPWVLLLQWPLYPNFVSMSFFGASAVLFIEATSKGRTRIERIRCIAGFVLTIVAFYFAQPNTAFSVAIALIPYCAWRCADIADIVPGRFRGNAVVRVACSSAFLVFAAVVWFVLYKAPFLQGVINFQWDAVCSLPDAVAAALNLSQNTFIPQYALAAAVLLGAAGCLVRRECRWIACAYVLFGVVFVSTYGSEGVLKHALAGFWYTDYYRIAATMAIVGVPVAAYGLYGLWRAGAELAHRLGFSSESRFPAIAGAAILCCVFCLAVFSPSQGNVYSWLRANATAVGSTGAAVPLDVQEQCFIEEAKQAVGEDALLVNIPYDGSMYSYGADDTNLYYRYISGYGSEDEKRESEIIRERLRDVASDDEVKNALDSLDADYVLLLDEDEGVLRSNPDYKAEEWQGFEGITDETPGFEVVLAQDGMRLYHIVA